MELIFERVSCRALKRDTKETFADMLGNNRYKSGPNALMRTGNPIASSAVLWKTSART